MCPSPKQLCTYTRLFLVKSNVFIACIICILYVQDVPKNVALVTSSLNKFQIVNNILGCHLVKLSMEAKYERRPKFAYPSSWIYSGSPPDDAQLDLIREYHSQIEDKVQRISADKVRKISAR